MMFEMLRNLVLGLSMPAFGVLTFLLLAALMFTFVLGLSVLIGVIRSDDKNIRNRFSDVFWAARDKEASNRIGRLRGR